MSFFSGCQDARNMISIVEIKCPKCGADIEEFVRDGKTVGDSVCDQCGYTIKEKGDFLNHRMQRDSATFCCLDKTSLN